MSDQQMQKNTLRDKNQPKQNNMSNGGVQSDPNALPEESGILIENENIVLSCIVDEQRSGSETMESS